MQNRAWPVGCSAAQFEEGRGFDYPVTVVVVVVTTTLCCSLWWHVPMLADRRWLRPWVSGKCVPLAREMPIMRSFNRGTHWLPGACLTCPMLCAIPWRQQEYAVMDQGTTWRRCELDKPLNSSGQNQKSRHIPKVRKRLRSSTMGLI